MGNLLSATADTVLQNLPVVTQRTTLFKASLWFPEIILAGSEESKTETESEVQRSTGNVQRRAKPAPGWPVPGFHIEPNSGKGNCLFLSVYKALDQSER